MPTITELTKRVWHIDDIQAMTEDDAKSFALDTMQIKGHSVYFVDFGGYFKYSALVFADGMHIYYANEYELHHSFEKLDHAGLKARYIKALNHKLFTEEEFVEPLRDYDDYQAKAYFLHNYYGMRRPNETIFHINPSPAEEAAFRKKVAAMTFNPVCFAYYEDKAFVEHCIVLHVALEKAWSKRQNDFEVMRDAFIREMYDHEYSINWQADFDTLSAFGNIEWRDGDYTKALHSYFDQLGFTDTQRNAYFAARKEYYRQIGESED